MITINNKPLNIDQVGIVGWAGRDRADVQAHIDELTELGVKPPSHFPLVYHVSPNLLTQSQQVDFVGDQHSGEVEVCVFADAEQQLWVTLASDHTDRELEVVDVAFSKQVCAKPVADNAWAFDEVIDHWDSLTLTCEIKTAGQSDYQLYQQGSIDGLLHINDIFATLPDTLLSAGKLKPNTLLLCGTLSAIGGINCDAESYRMTLKDPVHNREINHIYHNNLLPRNQ